MKRSFYAISLLISIFVMLGHSAIPHHHHEHMAVEYSDQHLPHYKQIDNHLSHHHHTFDRHHPGEKAHYEHHTTEKTEHNKSPEGNDHHSFPKHFHITGHYDFEFTRIAIGFSSFPDPYLTILYKLNDIESLIFEPPKSNFRFYYYKSVILNPVFMSQANGLRAPPFNA